MAAWPKSIAYNRAIELMRTEGHRLMLMTTQISPDGKAHFIVPGGYVSPEVAAKIKAHPQVLPQEDGLFPGHSQTWQFLRHFTDNAA